MDLVWRPFGLIATIAGLLALALAIVLLVAGLRRSQNRRLSLVLAADAVFFLFFVGLPYFIGDAATASVFLRIGETALMLIAVCYLSFLGTLETPFTAWARRAGPWLVLVIGGGLIASYFLTFDASQVVIHGGQEQTGNVVAWTFTWPGGSSGPLVQTYALAFLGLIAVSVLGLVAALHAWSRSPRGTPQRQRNAWLAAAFVIRDLGVVAGFGMALIAGQEGIQNADLYRWLVQLPMMAEILFVPIIVYAIVRAQVFGIELTVRRGLPRAVPLALIPVGFIVVSETIELLLTARAGLIAGLATAVAVGALFVPLQRWVDRLTGRIMPGVEDTEAYRRARNEELYVDAFEAIVQDGRIEPHERVALERLQAKLGLEADAAEALEERVRPAINMPVAASAE